MRNFFKALFALIIVFSIFQSSQAQVVVGPVSTAATKCAGDTFVVRYGTLRLVESTDTLRLISSTGDSFDIDTITVPATTGLSEVLVEVFDTLPPSFSGKYAVRIASSGLSIQTGIGDSITVNPRPVVTAVTPAAPVCSGALVNIPLTVSNPGTDSLSWRGVSSLSFITGAPNAFTAFEQTNTITNTLTNTSPSTADTLRYLIVPKSDKGCLGDTFQTSPITVNPKPVFANLTPASPICSGDSVRIALEASTPGIDSFSWRIDPASITGAPLTWTPFAATDTIRNRLVNTTNNVPATVFYWVQPKSDRGCVGDSVRLLSGIVVNPTPIVTTTAPAPICSGVPLSLQLNASTGNGSTFTWVPSTTTVTGAKAQPLVFASGSITDTLVDTSNVNPGSVSYLITPKSAAGCVGNSQTVVVTVNAAPVLNLPTLPTPPFCSRMALNIQLTATTPGANTFAWTALQNGVIGATTQPAGGPAAITDVVRTTNNNNAGTVIYRVTPRSSFGCDGEADTLAPITVHPDPRLTPVPAPPDSICSGTLVNIGLTAGTAGPNTFTWTATQTGASGATQPLPLVFVPGPIVNTLTAATNSASGTVRYIITPKSGIGCEGVPDTFNIKVNPRPVVTTTSPAAPICSGSSINLPLVASTAATFTWAPTAPGVNGATGQFVFGPGPIINTLTSTSNANVDSVRYLVTPRSASGCEGSPTTLVVKVNPAPSVTSVAPPATACSGAPFSIPLVASTGSGSTFRWRTTFSAGVSGATPSPGYPGFVSASSINTVLSTPNNQGQGTVSYTIKARSAAMCEGLDSATYTVVVSPAARLTKLLDSVCSGVPYSQSFLSNASTPSYTWTVIDTPGTLDITGGNNVGTGSPTFNTFSYSNAGQSTSLIVKYSVTTSGGANCPGTDTFSLKILPRPVVNNVSPAAICSGTQVTVPLTSSIADANNVIFTWSFIPVGVPPPSPSSTNVSNGGIVQPCINCSAITQVLESTPLPIIGHARYSVTASYFGCQSLQPTVITVPVNPTPTINSLGGISGPPDSLCSGQILNVTVGSTVSNTHFRWTVDTSQGISGAKSQTAYVANGVILDTLKNSSNSAVGLVEYTITPMTASPAGCLGNDTSFLVKINPKPEYTPTEPTICSKDSVMINLLGNTSTGVNSRWWYSFTPGPNASGGQPSLGTGPQSNPVIKQQLRNSGSDSNTYAFYTIAAQSPSGCNADTVRDTVIIRPLPKLVQNKDDTAICSGPAIFMWPLNATTGLNTQYTWQKVGSNIGYSTPPNLLAVGAGLKDSLHTGGLLSKDSVEYEFTLVSPAGCRSDSSFTERPRRTVVINPTPHPVSVDSLLGTRRVCVGAQMINFGANRERERGTFGETFFWDVVGRTDEYSNGGRYALLSFSNTREMQRIEIISRADSSDLFCPSVVVPYDVSVEGTTPRNPLVVRFGSNLVCLNDATGDTIERYQWGYDSKRTLDSVVFHNQSSQTLLGQTLDTTENAYWVMATYKKDGCTYKSYYNRMSALGVGNLAASDPGMQIKVYPNPAQALLNVEFPDLTRPVTLEVTDLTGRRAMQPLQATGNTQIGIADLPPGLYFLHCYRDGQRAATVRFIKN